MIIKFIKQVPEGDDYDTATVVVSFEAQTLDTIREEFDNFLRGCGFHIEEEE